MYNNRVAAVRRLIKRRVGKGMVIQFTLRHFCWSADNLQNAIKKAINLAKDREEERERAVRYAKDDITCEYWRQVYEIAETYRDDDRYEALMEEIKKQERLEDFSGSYGEHCASYMTKDELIEAAENNLEDLKDGIREVAENTIESMLQEVEEMGYQFWCE